MLFLRWHHPIISKEIRQILRVLAVRASNPELAHEMRVHYFSNHTFFMDHDQVALFLQSYLGGLNSTAQPIQLAPGLVTRSRLPPLHPIRFLNSVVTSSLQSIFV